MAYLPSMRGLAPNLLLIILALNTGWFVLYAANLGARSLVAEDAEALSRVFAEGHFTANVALAAHMIAGAVLTIGAPLQATPMLRQRWPQAHRRLGYMLVGLAMVTGVGGLAYIAVLGTIGGWWMSLWFTIYGIAIIWSAANTVYFALDKDLTRHFAWATRLVILAVGSWIYRMHYAIWFALTDGVGSNPEFTGPFDQIQVFAFFIPYLLIAEWFLRRRRAGPRLAG